MSNIYPIVVDYAKSHKELLMAPSFELADFNYPFKADHSETASKKPTSSS